MTPLLAWKGRNFGAEGYPPLNKDTSPFHKTFCGRIFFSRRPLRSLYGIHGVKITLQGCFNTPNWNTPRATFTNGL